jgi:hypothetical protein
MRRSPKFAESLSSTAKATFFDEINHQREFISYRSSTAGAGTLLSPPAPPHTSPFITNAPKTPKITSLRQELRSPSKETVMSNGHSLAESGATSSAEPFRPTVSLQSLNDCSHNARQNILNVDYIPANTSRSKIKGFFVNQQHGRGANPSKIEILAFPISGRSRSARVEFSTREEMMQALSDGQGNHPSIFVYVSQETIEEVRLQLRGLENDVAKQLEHMKTLRDRGEWRSCLAVFAILEASLTPAHYHVAMETCENSQKGDIADALMHFMTERKIKTEQRTIHACIRACCSSGYWEKAVKHLESILNSPENAPIEPELFDLLSSCLGFCGQWERALEIAGLKHANDSRVLRSSLIDEWRTFRQQNEDVFSFCRAALTARSGLPDAFRDLIITQKVMTSEFSRYSRDFEELAALPIACQHEDDADHHQHPSPSFE